MGFMLQVVNTVLIVYHFGFSSVIDNIYIFALLLFSLYTPIAILFGKLHVKHQYQTEIDASNANNTVLKDLNAKIDVILKTIHTDKYQSVDKKI